MKISLNSLFNLNISELVLLFLLSGLFFYAQPVTAQQAGVSLKPASFEETLDPGVERSYTVTVENRNPQEQTFYVFTRNISGVRDGGVPIFADSPEEKTGYEVSDWITLPVSEIVVEGNETYQLNFLLSVPENASPGSHFGGVFISAKPPEIERSGAAVGYQVATILNIRVSGEAIEQANIRQFSTSKFLYGSQNVEFSVRIENTGNVMVKPTGPLEIYNMLGNEVGGITFNEQQSGVFPYNTREFTDIVWKGDSIGFGRYEAILSAVYGDEGAKKTISSTVTFWILPMNIILPAIGVLAVLLLTVFIFVRIYIRRSLQHLSHGRRIVRRQRRGGSSAAVLLTVVTLTTTALFLIVLLALFA